MHSPPMEYTAPKTSPWLATVSLSIMLHLVLLALLSRYSGHKAKSLKLPGPIIVASLVYPSTPKIAVAENPESFAIIDDFESTLQSVDVQIARQGEGTPSETPIVNEVAVVMPIATAVKTTENVQDKVEASHQSDVKELASIGKNYSILGTGQSYIDSVEALKNQQMAIEESQAYQHAKVSPKLHSPTTGASITEDEKLTQVIQIKTDCSNVLNKTLRVITGIMGGSIQCSALPDIDSFIQARLAQHTRPSSSK
jgi:hypothetical protein